MENEDIFIETIKDPAATVWVPRADTVVDDTAAKQFEGHRPTDLSEEESEYRLSLTVIKGKKKLANAYYNWSGFTETCADYAYNMTHYRRMLMYPKPSDMLFVMRMLSLTGAGMSPSTPIEERLQLLDINYPLTNGRNDGIIEITEKGMSMNDELANYHITINYDKRFVDFSEVILPIKEENLMENGWIVSDAVDCPEAFRDFSKIKFKDITKFRQWVAYLASDSKIIRKDGELFHTIY